MSPRYLEELRTRYCRFASAAPDPLADLTERYRQYKATSLLDLATVASTLAIDTLESRDLDPLALKAIRDTNPTFDSGRVFGYSEEEWMGIVNSAKGKYFEYLVVDKLNRGERVGDLVLPDGYRAAIADSPTQPGWDIKILDEDGQVAEYLQLKATDNVAYVREAMERYPDITILATDEVAEKLRGDAMVLDSDLREADVERVVGASLDGTGGSFIGHFWDAFNPLAPLLVIAATQGYRVAVNKQHVASAVEVAKARAIRGLAAGGVGALVKAIGAGWLAIPAAIFTGWWIDRLQTIEALTSALHRSNERLAAGVRHYGAVAARTP